MDPEPYHPHNVPSEISSHHLQDTPLKRGPGRPKGSKNSPRAGGAPGATPGGTPGGTPGRRGRPPVPPELRQPGITDMKKFCKAAGIRFDYKKLVEGNYYFDNIMRSGLSRDAKDSVEIGQRSKMCNIILSPFFRALPVKFANICHDLKGTA